MAAKALDPSSWKSFAKGKSLRDAAYLEALEDWEDAADEIPRLRLDALEDLERCAKTVLDAARGNKAEDALQEWLDDAAAAIAVERKKALAEQTAQAAEDHDFDNDVRALTSGTVAMLRHVRRGQPTHALIALLGQRCALRMARRPLTAPARELLATWLGASGGVRYLSATCSWQNDTITFVVQAPPAGLARLVRRALLEQTGKRHRVRVRGGEADEVDETTDDDDEADGTPGDLAAKAAGDAEWLEQRGRLAAFAPALRHAMQARRPDARKLGALLVFADRKLKRRQIVAARQALDALSALLAANPPTL